VVNPPRPGQVREWTYDEAPVHLLQGEEMGRFLLGSTVVLLWPRDTVTFHPDWAPEAAVKMGEAMGDAF
jgi:phosphatidylserine decarboxylase